MDRPTAMRSGSHGHLARGCRHWHNASGIPRGAQLRIAPLARRLSALGHANLGQLCIVTVLAVTAACAGCREQSAPAFASGAVVAPTSQQERAGRRAYDGAPPVVPHARLGASCTECHTETGKPVPQHGFAPANPHGHTAGLSEVANCSQCHVFQKTERLFRATEFVGQAQTLPPEPRMYAGAPPMIPHRVFMRENCTACHGGPAARPEIRCSHPERTNCRQCHLETESSEEPFAALASH